jgi:hypothetical protein
MCGRSYVGRGMRHGMWPHAGGREFMGRDVEKMSPGARILAALSVLLPVGFLGCFWSRSYLLCGGSSRPTSGSLSLRSGCS